MPDRLALIIANSHFDDERLSRLVAPNEDALALKRVLENKAIGSFRVQMLVDEPFQRIREAIVDLYERRKRSDLLLLYYSGHGITDDYGELYLAAKDTRVESVSAAGVDAAFVRKCLNRSNSQRKVLILDCCHSGAFASGAKAAVGSSVGTEAAFAGSGYGWGILTASNALEFAWEDATQPPEARTSVFTHFLVHGIETGAADLNQDGIVSLQELYDYTREQILASGKTTQTPMLWVNQMEGQIVVAQNPHPHAGPSMLSPGLQQAIADSRAWMREGAVSELARLLRGPNEALAQAARQMLEKMVHDDSRRVSSAATAALRGAAPPPAAKIPQPPPEPELHPSIKVSLSVKPAVADVNEQVTWTLSLRNNGDDDLRQVVVNFGRKPRGTPFDLPAGKRRRFTFDRTYTKAGDKREQVVVEGVASRGARVRDTAKAKVTVRRLPKPVTSTPHTRLREAIKALARTAYPDAAIQCPICDAHVAGRNLVRHFDKVHSDDATIDVEAVLSTIEKGTPTPAAQPRKQGASPRGTARADFESWMKTQPPETLVQCPICNATLQAKNLLWHYDRRHAKNTVTSPFQAGTAPRLKLVPQTKQAINITAPIRLKLLRVPAGEFLMGSDPAKDHYAKANEQPQHRVNLPEYYIGERPITNAQYEVFVKATGHDVPESWKRLLRKPKMPSGAQNSAVTGITWYDALAFCRWLSQATGKTFRLPTEAEWEKAARGTGGQISAARSKQKTAPGQINWLSKPPQTTLSNTSPWLKSSMQEIETTSPFGCLNMVGRGWEWTHSLFWKYPYRSTDGREDESATGKRATRGGGLRLYTSRDHPVRYAERSGSLPDAPEGIAVHFRVVLLP